MRDGWKPMDTAPHDRPILIWCSQQEEPVVGLWNNRDTLPCFEVSYSCWSDAPQIWNAVAWMDTPEGPAITAEETFSLSPGARELGEIG